MSRYFSGRGAFGKSGERNFKEVIFVLSMKLAFFTPNK
jgi:hypothetical protein